jgi:hypothetical protein
MAADYWRKAAENSTVNPLVYVSLLHSYYSNSVVPLPLDYTMPDAMCAEYKKLVDRALELAPDCMEAYELLAMIESQSRAIRTKEMNKVIDSLPAMRDTAKTYLALAIIYWRLKKSASSSRSRSSSRSPPSPSPRRTHPLPTTASQATFEPITGPKWVTNLTNHADAASSGLRGYCMAGPAGYLAQLINPAQPNYAQLLRYSYGSFLLTVTPPANAPPRKSRSPAATPRF